MASKFESDIAIRPSDIDINGHVHNSIYFDYVEQARLEQMTRNYHYPMERFWQQGLSWVAKTVHTNFRRPINLLDRIKVITWLESWQNSDCRVEFQIIIKNREKIAAAGYFIYTLIDMKNGRPMAIPEEVVQAFSI